MVGLPKFGIVTALPKELAAVRTMLDSPKQEFPKDDPNIYWVGEFPAPDGKHVIVLTLLTNTGNNSAAAACSHLLRSYPSVQHVIMAGIGAGVSQPDDVEKRGGL